MNPSAAIHADRGIRPVRFSTEEDAKLFMECLRTNTEYPPEKRIPPFVIKDGIGMINPDYANARFELGYYYGYAQKIP